MAISQKGNQAEVLSVLSLQVESILPVAHNEEKVKTTSFMFLMFLCQKWTYLCQNPKDEQLTRSLIHLPSYLTCQPVSLKYCQFFSVNFNIMSALSVHQSPTLPQKIDSREGLF